MKTYPLSSESLDFLAWVIRMSRIPPQFGVPRSALESYSEIHGRVLVTLLLYPERFKEMRAEK